MSEDFEKNTEKGSEESNESGSRSTGRHASSPHDDGDHGDSVGRGSGRRRQNRRNREAAPEKENPEFEEKLIRLNRVAKVVKGGRRFSFSALVVIGNKKGKVGIGFGKANEVPEAIRKAIQDGKKNLKEVEIRDKRTIYHNIIGRYKSAKVLLKPAAAGTGIIAGAGVRAVVELAGIHDILSKSLGSSNILNIVKAVLNGLEIITTPQKEAAKRGKELEEIFR